MPPTTEFNFACQLILTDHIPEHTHKQLFNSTVLYSILLVINYIQIFILKVDFPISSALKLYMCEHEIKNITYHVFGFDYYSLINSKTKELAENK